MLVKFCDSLGALLGPDPSSVAVLNPQLPLLRDEAAPFQQNWRWSIWRCCVVSDAFLALCGLSCTLGQCCYIANTHAIQTCHLQQVKSSCCGSVAFTLTAFMTCCHSQQQL